MGEPEGPREGVYMSGEQSSRGESPTASGVDLAAWLRQQIDADVEDARESPEWSQWMIPPSRMAARVRKVLDECDTKRRIIAECQYWYDKVERGEDYPALADRFEVAFGILRLLALPYRDRPGYLEVWAPDGR